MESPLNVLNTNCPRATKLRDSLYPMLLESIDRNLVFCETTLRSQWSGRPTWGTIYCALHICGRVGQPRISCSIGNLMTSTKRKIFPVPIMSDPNYIAHVYERLCFWKPYQALGIVLSANLSFLPATRPSTGNIEMPRIPTSSSNSCHLAPEKVKWLNNHGSR